MTLRVLAAVLLVAGCPRVSVDRAGRACSNGECAAGYRCHPETDTCAPNIPIGCDDPDAQCAWTTSTGDTCQPAGAFLPCVDGREDCRGGCRTCRENGEWSACSDPDCQLGQLWSCDRCDHDCRELIAHAEPTCDTGIAPSECDYLGSCLGAWVDADRVRGNGCECLPTGAESCNGRDDDCDGFVDNGATCAGTAICEDGGCVPCTLDDPEHCGSTCADCDDTAVCEGGECTPCTDSDPLHCGPTCQLCTGESPSCSSGACACVAGSCASGHWCDNGTCRTCTDDDDAHCGAECLACSGETDTCIGGSCQCTVSSCDGGRWCNAGSCAVCDVPEHCGSSCVQCPPATPTCAAGACECVTGSCPPGQWCDAGTCAACTCPTLFAACVDEGGSYVCRCSATSCGSGGSCEDDDTTCVWADNFDGATSMLSLCSGNVSNSWAWRTPTVGACRSASACWVTNPDGNYNNCELSCVQSPLLDLEGVTGRIDVRLWARYKLEDSYDGVTVLFLDDSGNLALLDPTGGWDIDTVILGETCSWGFNAWPAFGQYDTTAWIDWTEIHFGTDSTTSPGLFFDGFGWRVYLQTDGNTRQNGWYMDDVEVRVTHSP